MEKELDLGNIEYKRFIKFSTPKRQGSLISQLRFRLKEGNGFCIYYIGLDNDGDVFQIDTECYNDSLENLKFMCNVVNAHIISILKKSSKKDEPKRDEHKLEKSDNFYYEIKIGDNIPNNEYRILNICTNDKVIMNIYEKHNHNYKADKKSLEFVGIGIGDDNNILNNDEYSIYDIKKNSKTLLYIMNTSYSLNNSNSLNSINSSSKIIQNILTFKPHLINFENSNIESYFYKSEFKSIDELKKVNSNLLQLFKSMNINYTYEEDIVSRIHDYKELLVNHQDSKNAISYLDVLFNGSLLNDTKIYAFITNKSIIDKDNLYLHSANGSNKLDIIDIQHIGQSSFNIEVDKLISISTKIKIRSDNHICNDINCTWNDFLKDEVLYDPIDLANLTYTKKDDYTSYYKNEKLKVQFNDTYIKLNKKVILDEKYLIIDLVDEYLLVNVL